jgi:hypothetical protein
MQLFDQLFEFQGQLPMFISTKPDSSAENRKAHYKNYNLPILQHIYMGDPKSHLACVVNRTPAFAEFPCIVQKRPLTRFRIEFNHIRQRAAEGRQAGHSIDKNPQYGPSDLFRSRGLDDPKYRLDLIEFMTMMPVDADAHKWITQSSAYGDITLVDFAPEFWPWHLQSPENFRDVCERYKLEFLDYDQFIDHLSSPHHPPVHERVHCEINSMWQRVWTWR